MDSRYTHVTVAKELSKFVTDREILGSYRIQRERERERASYMYKAKHRSDLQFDSGYIVNKKTFILSGYSSLPAEALFLMFADGRKETRKRASASRERVQLLLP